MSRVQLRDLVAAILLSVMGREYRRVSMPVQMQGETFFLIFPGPELEVGLRDLEALADALMIETDLIHLSPVVIFPPDSRAQEYFPVLAHRGPFEVWGDSGQDPLGRHVDLGARLYAQLRESLYTSSATLNRDGVPYGGPTSGGRAMPSSVNFFFGPALLLRITEELVDLDAADPCAMCGGTGWVTQMYPLEGEVEEECPDCRGTGLR